MLGRQKISGNKSNKQVMKNVYLILLVVFVTLDAEAFFTGDDEINGNGFESATHSTNTVNTGWTIFMGGKSRFGFSHRNPNGYK